MKFLASTYDPTLYDSTYTTTTYSGDTSNPFMGFIYLIVAVLIIVATWKMYMKAGKPGWAAIVPFYNTWVLMEVAGRPGWWLFLMFIPLVNIVIYLIVCFDLAKRFGKGGAFAFFGLFLFPFVGFPMLGFGKAKYTKMAR